MYFLLNFGWYSIQLNTEIRTGWGGGGGLLNKQNLLSVMVVICLWSLIASGRQEDSYISYNVLA